MKKRVLWQFVFLVSLSLFVSSSINFIIAFTSQPHQCMNASPYLSIDKDLHRILTTTSRSAKRTVLGSKKPSSAFRKYNPATDSCNSIADPLHRHLCEVESATVFYSPNDHPTVVAKDLSILRYYAQRDLEGWMHAYRNISFDVSEYNYKQGIKLSELSVLLCLGITSQDKHCLKPSAYKTLAQGQRISQVHLLRDVLWRKDAFCYTLKEALRGYNGWSNFTFPCWVLPQDKESLEKYMQTNGGNYIVKPSFRGEGHGIFVTDDFNELDYPGMDNFVVQPFLNNPYLIKGKKFDLRTYVLVTSISPLRLYFYNEGLARFASSKYNPNATRGGKEQQYLTNTSVGKKYTKLADLTWTYQKLSEYFTKKGIDSNKVFAAVQNAITRTLLATEFRFISDSKFNLGGYTCSNCFQLLGVDVILDHNLHPIVIEVNGLPSMQLSHELGEIPNPSSVYTLTKYGLMSDMLNIIYGNISVARELSTILKLLHIGVGPAGAYCNRSVHVHCLDYVSLKSVISLYRESLLSGDYLSLYPVSNGENYSKFVRHMSKLVFRKLDDGSDHRTLWDTHHVFTAVKKITEYLKL